MQKVTRCKKISDISTILFKSFANTHAESFDKKINFELEVKLWTLI